MGHLKDGKNEIGGLSRLGVLLDWTCDETDISGSDANFHARGVLGG